ncbi:hypothetical protein VTO58DRAFT_108486 [Aureobasidium pullulans]|nr:hypothetical protein JADG_009771 [Aureobasidium pullulans]
MIRDNIDVKRSINLAKASIQEAYQGRTEIKGHAKNLWNSLVEADRISCYAYQAYFNVHYEHMCTKGTRKGAGKACETHRKASVKSTFDQIDMVNIAMFVNATNPVDPVNAANKHSGGISKMLTKQRAFI